MEGISNELHYVCNKCDRELYISRISYLNNIEIKCSCNGVYVPKYMEEESENVKSDKKEKTKE